MPGLLERVASARSAPARQRPANLSLDEYAELFRFTGFGGEYPLLRTSMGKLDEERLVQTATAAYRASGPVFALVVARLQVFSQIRFAWTRFEGGQPTDLFGTTALGVLERPWWGGTTADLLARMEVDVSSAGTSYTRKITRRGTQRLVRLRPEHVIVVLGSDEDADHPAEAADVELLGFAYAPPMGPMVLLDRDEVALYAPLPDPDRVFLGMSWVTPVLRELQADSAQSEHKLAYFRNSATPNLALKFDPSITIEQVREFKALFEEEHVGPWQAWKTLYLGGGA
ncbi:MAG TPA: phage portal protein, partial [Actinomycetes bacterium]|nr:phage portal protein [Actinomycetes bacterium]